MKNALYGIAIISLLIGIILAILTVLDPGMDEAKTSTKVSTFIMMLSMGVFICGIIFGITAYIGLPVQIRRTIGFLFILSLVELGLLTTSAVLDFSQQNSYFFDVTDKIGQFLTTFSGGLFNACILSGIAVVIGLKGGVRFHCISAIPYLIYSIAGVLFLSGIAQAVLSIVDLGGYATGIGKATLVLIVFLGESILYAGILMASGYYIRFLLNAKDTVVDCQNCGANIQVGWKACPSCAEVFISNPATLSMEQDVL